MKKLKELFNSSKFWCFIHWTIIIFAGGIHTFMYSRLYKLNFLIFGIALGFSIYGVIFRRMSKSMMDGLIKSYDKSIDEICHINVKNAKGIEELNKLADVNHKEFIKLIFNIIENKDKTPSERLSKLRMTLNKIRKKDEN